MTAALVLASAFLHALWNALLKREDEKDVAGVAVVGVALASAAVVAVIVAIGSGRVPFVDAGAAGAGRSALIASAIAGLFEAGYFVTLVMALERAPLGVAYTVSRGVAIVLVWPISVLALGEPFAARAAAGTGLVVLGLAAGGLERGARGGDRARGALLAVACGGFIAGYHLSYKRAMAFEPSAAAVFTVALAVAWPLNVARLGRARRAVLATHLRTRPGRYLAYGAVCAASFLLFLAALKLGGAGRVLTLRNASILFATGLAWALGDRPTARQMLAACLVAAGAAFLSK